MPASYTFTSVDPAASAVNGLTPRLNAGSENDTAEGIFRKHFNPGIESFEPGWDALIKGISAGDEINFDNARKAVNQLWIHSASGIYLDRRAADQGVVRPESVGLSDDVFRRLVIKTTTKKVVTQALLEAMEVFYGTDSTRANLTCIDEPYALAEGYELLLSIDGNSVVTVPFVNDDFDDINVALAKEVSAVITRWLQANDSEAYALEITNAITGAKAVRIYSSSLGLESSVQVLGGQAQNELQFPTLLTTSQGGDTWVVSLPSPGVVRFKITGVTGTDLNRVSIGDYVNIFGTGFNAANLGTFTITNVDVRYVTGTLNQYFEVALSTGVAQVSVVAIDTSDLVFFHPTRTTINDNGVRAVIVAQHSPREVDVQLPVTTIAVSRTAKTGAYANTQNSVEVATLTRHPNGTSVIVTTEPHGLSVDGQVILDGIEPDGLRAPVNAGNGTSTTTASQNTHMTSIAAPPTGTAASGVKSLLLSNGDVFMCGGANFVAAAETGVVASSHRLRISSPSTLTDTSIRYSYLWVATTNMPVAANFHAIALMNDSSQMGNVLLSGGTAGPGTDGPGFATSYIYKVASNAWSVNIPMTTGRLFHSLTTLNDGRVLAAGGYGATADSTPTAELFSPVALSPGGSWAATGSMLLSRAEHAAIKLASGKVLIIGGWSDTTGTPTEKCELFDPATNTFSAAGSMGYARSEPRAVLLPNDRVLVCGGYGHLPRDTVVIDFLTTAEIYDGATGRWSPIADNPRAFEEIAYLSGTNQVIATNQGSSDIYEVGAGRWIPSLAHLNPDTYPTSDYFSLVPLTSYPIVVQAGGQTSSGDSILGATLYIASGDLIDAGGLNDKALEIITVDSPNQFTVKTPDYAMFLSNSAQKIFLAIDFVGDVSIVSPDGATWEEGTMSSASLWTSAAWNGTVFCAVAFASDVAATSPDGITWTAQTLPSSELWQDIAWNGTVFCAVASSSNVAATSPDGITWTARTLPSSQLKWWLAWNGTVFCAVGTNSSAAATSPDGITWTARILPSNEFWYDVAWNGSVFCAIASGTAAATSPDGITWTAQTLSASNNWVAVAAGGNVFCAIAYASDDTLVSSDNGVTWTSGNLPSVDLWSEVAWNDKVFATVAGTNKGATSPDGLYWTTHTLPAAVTYGAITTGSPRISGVSTAVAQESSDANVPGPYIYDPDHGFSITGIDSVTTSPIYTGTKYSEVGVTPGDATDFADAEGWLLFGFGTEQQFGPVKYVGRKDANTLILDFGTMFPGDLDIGTSVILLNSKGPFVPEDAVDVGSLYITDSSSGRIAASATLDELVAAGIDLVKTVVYPGDVGLGAAGLPASGKKISDKVEVWSGNGIDEELNKARGQD